MEPTQKEITLDQMAAGQRGVVSRVIGGHGLIRRLENLGIRPGQEIKKVSAMLLAGPVVVKIHGTDIALGRGMARKILITLS